MMKRRTSCVVGFLLVCAFAASGQDTGQLADRLRPYLSVLDGTTNQFTLTADGQVQSQPVKVTLSVTDAQTFALSVEHPQYPLILKRESGRTIFALPAHHVQFIGEGELHGDDILAPDGALDRLISDDSTISTYYSVLKRANAYLAAATLTKLAGLHSDNGGSVWTAKSLGSAKLTFGDGNSLTVEAGGSQIHARLVDKPTNVTIPDGLTVVKVDRTELERLFVRGVRRSMEVAAPGSSLTSPSHSSRKVAHGELRWNGDQRLVLLAGRPREIGAAHGALLKAEARRCCDSALYMVGLGATVATGKWFPDELRGAYARLAPHIPEDHKVETDALADAAGIPREEGRLANVFPELFHCSGFALFGRATVDGKLYHGRVLDYMTMVGLQDAATTFVVVPEGKIPFVNVGYAGFVGSVSGMNAKQISLGEMGGRGQGQWDGVPMAMLMRRALEECSTLEEVKHLWSTSPRTCEYYYVFADGKGPDAVACSATPQRCDFLKPGEDHPQLGPGIADAVVLSAGSRLTELRARVQANYGKIDAERAMGLMCRPVAMKSNLHNALFVPQDGVFYVANADHKHPAAERPYARYDLNALLRTMPGAVPESASTGDSWFQRAKGFFTGKDEGTLP
jgi:hypothetical protein